MRPNLFQFHRIPTVFLLWAAIAVTTSGQTPGDATVVSAIQVLDEVMAIPANQIPQSLLKEARGVAIIPGVVKGGFVVGLRHGRGVILVKDEVGNWHQPTFISMTGGSVGWQAGIQSTDVVLVFRTARSVNSLMSGRLKIGVDAAAAAGPIGRETEAATDTRFSAEIYSYSRSRGLFAGVSLEGSGLQMDYLAEQAYYVRDTAGNPTRLPETAVQLMNRVAKYSGSNSIAVSPNAAVSGIPQAGVPQSMQPAPQAIPANSGHTEIVRQQLVASWQQLSLLMDSQWKGYMALPQGVVSGSGASAQEVNAVMNRFASVAANPQYASLVQRHEYSATYQLLREYATLLGSPAQQLTLPPPPANSSAGATSPRY